MKLYGMNNLYILYIMCKPYRMYILTMGRRVADINDTDDIIEMGADGAAAGSGPYSVFDVVDAEAVELPMDTPVPPEIDGVAGTRLDVEQHKIAALVADGVSPEEIREQCRISEKRLADMLADPGVQAEIGRQVLGAGLASRNEQAMARKSVLNTMRRELNRRAAAGDFADMRLADLLKEFRAGLKELRDLATDGADSGSGAPGTVNNILVNIQNMSPEQLNEFVRRQTSTMRLIPGGRA